MNGPFVGEYWEATCTGVEASEKMKVCDLVERGFPMNDLPATWAFKYKRYPDGLIKKFKAIFCVKGGQQIEGVPYFET